MRENEPDSLPFDSPEQETVRLKDENRRLRRLLEVESPVTRGCYANQPA